MCVCVYLDFNDGDRDRRVNEEPQCVRGGHLEVGTCSSEQFL